MEVEFRKLWVGNHDNWFGQIAHSDTIRLLPDNTLDIDSVVQVFGGIPTNDPTINSRVILLIAQSQHAFGILEHAVKGNFQPDTIWVGTSSWIQRNLLDGLNTTGSTSPDLSWLPTTPGYIGVALFNNRDLVYQEFFGKFQKWQQERGKNVLDELPPFSAETVDAIFALSTAISSTINRDSSDAIVGHLRQLKFAGVSGPVEFTPIGDRKDPRYSIFNAKSIASDGRSGVIQWYDIGSVGTTIDSAKLSVGIQDVCFAVSGCGLAAAPDDTYPVPPGAQPVWAVVIVPIVVLLCFGFAAMYWRSKMKKRAYKAELKAFQESIAGMRTAAFTCIPRIVKIVGDIEQPVDLSGTLSVAPIESAQWSWKETDQFMSRHSPSDIFGDPKNCWIRYGVQSNKDIEEAFQSGAQEISILAGYVVNFTTMLQTKIATGFTRDIQRVIEMITPEDDNDQPKKIDLSGIEMADVLPDELVVNGEPQMVLVEGDVIQISKQRSDGWAFGTKVSLFNCSLQA
jgi:Receptor family ligand binding region/WWE domain